MYSINDFEKVTDIFRKHIGGLKALYLFGSYARGDADEESDIDIAAIVQTRPYGIERQLLLTTLYNKLGENGISADIVFKPAAEFAIDQTIPITLSHTIVTEGRMIWKTDD